MADTSGGPIEAGTADQKAEDSAVPTQTSAETPAEPPNENNGRRSAPVKIEPPGAEKPKPMEIEVPAEPVGRDVIVGDDTHKGTMMLMDLIRLHFFLKKRANDGDTSKLPSDETEAEGLASRLTTLMLEGKKLVLSGIKDVPAAFLEGPGRFFRKSEGGSTKLSTEQAQEYVAKTIVAKFQEYIASLPASGGLESCVDTLFKNNDPANRSSDEPSTFSAPRPCDVLFLPIDYPLEENMPYEHQSGNKHLLFLASQYVAPETNDTKKRVEAAFKLVSSKVEVNSGTELLKKNPRYVAQEVCDNHNSWRELDVDDLAEVSGILR